MSTFLSFNLIRESGNGKMAVGETACVFVEADKLWNDSGIDVSPSETYNFVVPNGETWTDWHKPSSADGYPSTPFLRWWEPIRRVRDENWFKLIATIGRSDRSPIVVGSHLVGFSPASAGRLHFFANDVSFMYWNNKGSIHVRVTRTR